MIHEMKHFFDTYPGTPLYPDRRCSVRFSNTYRFDKAKEQATLQPVAVNEIISFVNDFLGAIGIPPVESPRINNPMEIDYREIQQEYALKSIYDIVWMKFTKDGYLGVVAGSNDINFKIPSDATDYSKKEWSYNEYRRRYEQDWTHNSAGILLHQLGKEWDTSFVLVFPLSKIPEGYTHGDIEKAIGNYLIANNVPILDFYSHNYQRKDYVRAINNYETEERPSIDIVDEVLFDMFPNAKTEAELEYELECWDWE